MKKQWITLSIVATMLALMFAGVGAGTAQTVRAEDEKITVTLTNWGEISDQDVNKIVTDEFNETNDQGIVVKYDVVPGDGYGDRLTTSFSSGEGYDIFLSGEGDFFKWVDMGLAASLDPYIAEDESFENSMDPAIYQMGRIYDEQYYIVKDYNPIALWYNKDVFDARGVDYPTDDWTWDDLFAAAKELTVLEGDDSSFGFNAQSWSYAVYTYLESKGLSIVSEDGETVDGYLNSPEVAEALADYVMLAKGDDRVSPSPADLDTFGNASAMLANSKLGMTIGGGWERKPLMDAGTNYGIALVPGNHTSLICAAGYTIGSKCPHPEAAWEVLKLITGPETSAMRVENEAILPAYTDQLEAFSEALDDSEKALVDTLQYGVQPIGLRSKAGNLIDKNFNEAMEQIIFATGEEKNLEEVQKILDETVQTIMDQLAEK